LPERKLPEKLFIIVKSGTLFVRKKLDDSSVKNEYLLSALNDTKTQVLLLQAQNGIILDAMESHMLYSNGSVSYIWITFTGDMEVPLSGQFVLTDSVSILQYNTFLQRYIREPYKLPLCDHLLALMLGEVWLQKNAVYGNSSQLCRNIMEWIQNHSDYPITVNDVAEALSYNMDYISRLFRRVYPEGIKQYIVNERINRIKYMLLTTDLPIKEIVSQLHFSSYKQFHKFFIRQEQMSPTKYRMMFLNTGYDKKFM